MNRAGFILITCVLVVCDDQEKRDVPVVIDGAQADSMGAAASRDSLTYVRWNLPPVASKALSRQGHYDRYDLFLGINPYYQRGYFDGDSVADAAIWVIEKATGKRGIAIVHGGDSSVHLLGAGTPFGSRGDDFRSFWVWRVEARTICPDIAPAGHEVLYVEKPESSGGLIWWNGTAY